MSTKQNNPKQTHDCVIGLICKTDYSELVTVDELKQHIKENEEFNEYAIKNGLSDIVKNVYHLYDYASRRNTNLMKFRFCPFCGKKIELKKILLGENKEV